MSLPALAALIKACPEASIDVLARPWVAELYAMQPGVNQVLIIDEKGANRGFKGMRKLIAGLKEANYQWALLLQNAFKAAALAWLARIPLRIGYKRDARGFLLTHGVDCPPAIRKVHETAYYLNLLCQVGLAPAPPAEGVLPVLCLSPAAIGWADAFLAEHKLTGPLLGLAPGASFGPAKCWPAPNYAKAAGALARQRGMVILIFGSKAEAVVAEQVKSGLPKDARVLDLCGGLSLSQALALLARLDLLLTNDSGLMHAAAALGRPTLAIFGSTNPQTTRPLGPRVKLLRKDFDCAPCKKPTCSRGDLRCLWAITPDEVFNAAIEMLDNNKERA